MAAAAAIATVGAAVGQALGPEKVVRTCPAFARAADEFDVVNEVIRSHEY